MVFRIPKPTSRFIIALLSLVLFVAVVPSESFAQSTAGFDSADVDFDTCTVITEPGTSNFEISTVTYDIPADLIPADAYIGDIVITRYPIFNHQDPAEDHFLYRLADRLHIDTRAKAIKEQLIFESGDKYRQRVINEAARKLRELHFLYDARIWPYRICGKRVDLEVVVRDVWTIDGGFSAKSSGGNNETKFFLLDKNFLGRGEYVAISQSSSVDRDGIKFEYHDESVAGTRYRLNLAYGDNSDGFITSTKLERPFYSLDTHYSWGLRFDETRQFNDLYQLGEKFTAFESHEHFGDLYLGISDGNQNSITHRWSFGARGISRSFAPIDGKPAPVDFPRDQTINYPWIGQTRIEDDYIKTTNLNQIFRTEDFNRGASWSWLLGPSLKSFGSDRDRLVYSGSYRNGWQYDPRTLMQLTLGLQGLWLFKENNSEESVLSGAFRFYRGASRSQGTYVALNFNYARDLLPQNQILLGAEEGLRGFPSRYQSGDRSFLFTAERRFYTDWYPFRLFRIGGAVFFDAGRAWFPSQPKTESNTTLCDVGLGLLLSSTRAESNRVFHFDIGIPLNGPQDIDSYQISVTARQSF